MCYVKTHTYRQCPPGHSRVTLKKYCSSRPSLWRRIIREQTCARVYWLPEEEEGRCPSCAREMRKKEEREKKRKRRDQARLEWQQILKAEVKENATHGTAAGQGGGSAPQQARAFNHQTEDSRLGQIPPPAPEAQTVAVSRVPIRRRPLPSGSQVPMRIEAFKLCSAHHVNCPEIRMSTDNPGERPDHSEGGDRSTPHTLPLPSFLIPGPTGEPTSFQEGGKCRDSGTSRPRDSLFLPSSAPISGQLSKCYSPKQQEMCDVKSNTSQPAVPKPEATWGWKWRNIGQVLPEKSATDGDCLDTETGAGQAPHDDGDLPPVSPQA